MDKLAQLEAKIADLESDIRQKDRTITGIQHWLKVAATYQTTAGSATDEEVRQRQLEGIQAALLKAAEYQGRKQNGKGRR